MVLNKDTVAALKQAGLSHLDITLIGEVAAHAAKEAHNTLVRICETVPNHLQVHTIITAFMLLDGHVQNIKVSIDEFMEQHGGRIVEL